MHKPDGLLEFDVKDTARREALDTAWQLLGNRRLSMTS